MEKEKANLLLTEEGLKSLEEAKGAVVTTSVLPGMINPAEVAPTSAAPKINPEKEIHKIQAPRMNKGTNHTVGRPKDFLKARKKRQRMAKKSRRNNRRKK